MAMSYDQLKQKVLSRYGHIDSIPEPVYNAMKQYQTKGNDALDDDNTYNLLVAERDYTPDVISDRVQSSPMTGAELEKFYAENPDLKEEILKYAPSLPSVQANAPAPSPLDQVLGDMNRPSNNSSNVFGKGIPGLVNALTGAKDYAYENPGSAGLMALAPFVPMSWPGVATMLVGGTGAHAIDRVQQEQLHPTDTPINYKEEVVNALGAGAGSGLTHGAFGALGAGMRSFARPYMNALDEAAKVEALNASNLAKVRQIEKNAPLNADMQDVMEAEARMGTPEYEATLQYQRNRFDAARRDADYAARRAERANSSPEEERLRATRPDLFKNEPVEPAYDPIYEFGKQQEAQVILDEVKSMMLKNPKEFPEYTVGKVNLYGHGDRLIEPTNAEAARYLLKLKSPKSYDLAGKAYEALRGFPLLQRGIGAFAKGDGILSELAGKGYRIPSAIDAASTELPPMLNTMMQIPTNNLGAGLAGQLYQSQKNR